MKTKQQPTDAFSLIEISMVLLIISLLVGVSMIASAQLDAAKYKQTIEKMDRIEDAINNFVALNKRLPCAGFSSAASDDTSYFTEQCGLGEQGINTTQVNSNYYSPEKAAGRIVITVGGAVPTTALGLPQSYLLDGWDNKFDYVFTQDLVTDFMKTNMGAIVLYDQNGNVVVNNAAYLIVSHGPNGSQAWTRDGFHMQYSATNSSPLEGNNTTIKYDTTSFWQLSAKTYWGTNGSGDAIVFDDIVRYRQKHQVVSAAGKIMANYYCLNALAMYSPGNSPTTYCNQNRAPADLNCVNYLDTIGQAILSNCLTTQ